MKATLNDFGIKFKKVLLLCDNDSAIKLTNNLVGILKEQSLNLLDIRTPTMQDARLKERAHFGHLLIVGKITCFMVIKEAK